MHYSIIEIYKAQAAESECTIMNLASEISEKTVQILTVTSEEKSIVTEITENVILISEPYQKNHLQPFFVTRYCPDGEGI